MGDEWITLGRTLRTERRQLTNKSEPPSMHDRMKLLAKPTKAWPQSTAPKLKHAYSLALVTQTSSPM